MFFVFGGRQVYILFRVHLTSIRNVLLCASRSSLLSPNPNQDDKASQKAPRGFAHVVYYTRQKRPAAKKWRRAQGSVHVNNRHYERYRHCINNVTRDYIMRWSSKKYILCKKKKKLI